MATLYVKYTIEALIGYPEARVFKEATTTVGGVEVETLFLSTVSGGFNVNRLVEMSTTGPSSWRDHGFSTDAVGTTYWSYATYRVPDGSAIPGLYDKGAAAPPTPAPTMPPGEVAFTVTDRGFFKSETLSYADGKLLSAAGSASADLLSDMARDGFRKGAENMMAAAAAKLGITSTVASLSKVASVASALSEVHSNGGYVIEQLFNNSQMSSAAAAVLVDTYLLNSLSKVVAAAEEVTGVPGTFYNTTRASNLIKGVGYSAEIIRNTDTQGPGSGIKFNVFSGTANQINTGDWDFPDHAENGVIIIDGNTSSSTLYGREGNDVLVGGYGDDDLTPQRGNDAVIGGDGFDTVNYGGQRRLYSLARNGDTYTLTGIDPERLDRVIKVDTLMGIERVRLQDAFIALDVAGAGGQAYRLYQAAFNRKPDESGLGYQIRQLDKGVTVAEVAQNFIASPEFARTYGALDNNAFVKQLYQNVLHRAPDAGGLAFHVGNLASGAATRANVLAGFSESPENQAALIGVMEGGMFYL